MCGRYVLGALMQQILDQYGPFDEFSEHGASLPPLPLYNIAPTMNVPVVFRDRGKKILRPMKWGLIAPWSKEPKMQFSTFNARDDKLAASKLYAPSLKSRRCLIPATGFYEWQGLKGKKTCHLIYLKDQELFSLAGLWSYWKSAATGEDCYSFTIVTTTPNELVQTIHDRMPVVVPRECEEQWLNADTPLDDCLALLKPYPADAMHTQAGVDPAAAANTR